MDARPISMSGYKAQSLPTCWTVGPHNPLIPLSEFSEDPRLRPISKEDMIIAVMGPTGAGKSTFINIATQSQQAVVGHALDSCTQVVSAYACRHPDGERNVVLVDTPGFDDSRRTDGDILSAIADWLVATYHEKITLSGILYLHRISDNRMAGTPIRNLGIFRELCGQDALKNVILTTTLWSELAEEVTGRARETELITKFWRSMIVAGSRVSRFDGTHSGAWSIIDSFVYVPRPKPLLIQIEMVDQGKSLAQTSAGSSLLRWFNDLVRQIRDLIRRIETQLRAVRRDDSATTQAMQAQRDSLVAELDVASDQQRGLQEGKRHALRRTLSVAYTTLRRRPTRRDTKLINDVDPPSDCIPDRLNGARMAATVVALRHARDMAEIPPVPFLKGACRLALTIAEASQSMQVNSRALQGIVQNTNQFLSAIKEQAELGELPKEVHDTVETLTEELTRINSIVRNALTRGNTARYFLLPAEEELLAVCEANIQHVCQIFQTRGIIGLHQAIGRIEAVLRCRSTPELSDTFEPLPGVPDIDIPRSSSPEQIHELESLVGPSALCFSSRASPDRV